MTTSPPTAKPKLRAAFTDETMRARLLSSLSRLAAWVEQRGYRGYDPGDGLNSFLRPLAFGNRLAERILLQLIWKSPINIRPLVGVRPMDSTKGRGYMAWGYLRFFQALRDQGAKAKAIACLEWLMDHKAPGRTGYAWGNHFDFVTRSGCIPAGTPTIVWSGLIGQVFLEAYEQLGDHRFLEVARGICDWILELPREQTERGLCLSYVPFTQSSIHNSNMLGAALLARTWKHTRDMPLLETARKAMRYSCSRQLPDGAWWYGEERKYHWIDNFHTGYNLDSLKRYIVSTGDETFRPELQRGLWYYLDTFFEPSGRPRYYHNRTFPVDIQCAAQAIDTLAFFADQEPFCLDLAQKVARWTIDHMQDRAGFFFYRQYPWLMAKTPYLHWGQATMFKALTHLHGRLTGEKISLEATQSPSCRA